MSNIYFSFPSSYIFVQWASGYEAYDRLSPLFKTFLTGLTAEHDGNFFHSVAAQLGTNIQTPRGSELNSSTDLRAIQ
jgi:hypothetical protein